MKHWVILVSLALLVGCAQKPVQKAEPVGFNEGTGLTLIEFDGLAPGLVAEMFEFNWLSNFEQRHATQPTLMVGEIENHTGEILARTDFKRTLERLLLESGKVKLVQDNKSQADFILSGKIQLDIERTELRRVANYELNWQLENTQKNKQVWSAINRLQKVQERQAP
ncbi:MAG: hypothetical protein IBX48_05700 [Thiomicrospira sp.]|uniref:hypothetical protein n=1 Tax=Thiomicrospira sp. TaxID=935 RepID=UPI0019DA8A5B|nr:hypothetical protein [Thiomicrospira sp.]MBE0493818.1 hypothetical protein [Thiomicrospira sp.]